MRQFLFEEIPVSLEKSLFYQPFRYHLIKRPWLMNCFSHLSIPISFSCIFPFSSEQVRVVLFRECDWTGRRLLFDSSAVQKVCLATNNQAATTPSPSSSSLTSSASSANKRNEKLSTSTPDSNGLHSTRSYIDICNGYGYIYDQASCETNNNIGEMVFGSVAMSFKGTSLKVINETLFVFNEKTNTLKWKYNIFPLFLIIIRFIGYVNLPEYYALKYFYRQYFQTPNPLAVAVPAAAMHRRWQIWKRVKVEMCQRIHRIRHFRCRCHCAWQKSWAHQTNSIDSRSSSSNRWQ